MSINIGARMGVRISNGIAIGPSIGVQLAGRAGDVFVGPYDDIPNIAAAYGMRRLLASYTGPLLRLRRSSDNVESDFGYIADARDSVLDTAAIADWLGGNSGFVTTWYDQSGNGRNAAQSTAASQPAYVAAGQNSKPVLRFDGSDDALTLSADGLSVFRNVPGASVLAVVSHDVVGLAQIFSASNGATASSARFNLYTEANARLVVGGRRLDADSFQSLVGSEGHTAGEAWLQTGILDYANSDARLYKNGVSIGSTTSFQTDGSTSDTNSTSIAIGVSAALNVQFWDGDIAELVIANAAWNNTQRQAAESAANSYWSVYA